MKSKIPIKYNSINLLSRYISNFSRLIRFFIFFSLQLILAHQSGAIDFSGACINGGNSSTYSENICLLKPRYFTGFTFSTGYNQNITSLEGAMNDTLAYFINGRSNLCAASWSTGSEKVLNRDGYIESNEVLRASIPYEVIYSLFDKVTGECKESRQSGEVHKQRSAHCYDPNDSIDIATWRPHTLDDIKSNACLKLEIVRHDALPQMCSASDVTGDRGRVGNLYPEVAGNPVQISTGNKIELVKDVDDHKVAPLSFFRIYNSGWAAGKIDAPPNFLGKGWSHNHEVWMTSSGKHVGVNAEQNSSLPIGVNHETLFIYSATGEYATFHRTIPSGPGANGPATLGEYRGGTHGQTLTKIPTGWLYVNGEGIFFYLNNYGRIEKKALPNGDIYQYAYDPQSKRLASIVNQFGRSIQIFENQLTGTIDLTPSNGDIVKYKVENNLLRRIAYIDQSSVQYLYNTENLLSGKIDENNNIIGSYTYSNSRVSSSEKSPGIDKYLFNYDHNLTQRKTTITPPVGNSVNFYSERSGSLSRTRATTLSALSTTVADVSYYNSTGYLDYFVDYKYVLTKFSWDEIINLPTKVTEASGQFLERITNISWHPNLRKPVRIEVSGQVSEMDYDIRGNLKKYTKSNGGNVTLKYEFSYDSQDNLLFVTGPNGIEASYTYDENDNRKSFTDALGHVTQYLTYNHRGQLLSSIGSNGLPHLQTYDDRGRLTSSTVAGLTANYQYQLNGLLHQASFPGGYAITYNYDVAQRLIGWTDNRGNSHSYVLDAAGNRIQEQTKDSRELSVFEVARTVNGINRLSTQTFGKYLKTIYTYNANGDLVALTNALGNRIYFTLDELRRVSSVKNASDASTLLTRNALDSITQAKDFKGVPTNYTRDIFGNAKDETTPDAGNTTSIYDLRGLLTSTTDATGRTIGVDRDALGRITKLSYNDSTSSLLKHDLSGAAYNTPEAPNASIGSLSEVQDPGVTTQYQRDALSRVVRKTQTLTGGETRSTSYTYVPAGQGGAGSLKSITYPSGKTLEYSYDSTGLITGMAWNGAPLVSALKWSPLGVPTEWTWPGIKMSPTDPSALLESRQYDTAGQLIHSGLLDLTWDAAGRLTAIAQSHMIPGSGSDPAQRGMVSSSFNYNATGNLTASAHALMATPAVTLPAGVTLPDLVGYTSLGYSYDANGNRTSGVFTKATGVGTPLTLTRTYATTTGTNRLASVTTSSSAGGTIPAKTYEYDASGSLTNAAGQYLHYGANGRVAKLTNTSSSTDPLTVSYVYNSSSQRVLKTDARTAGTSSSEHAFYSDDDGTSPLGFYSSQRSSNSAAPAGENDSTELLYLPTANGLMPIAAQINGRIYAIDTDHLNTPRRLTNADGQVAWQWLITGFGEVSPTTGAGGYLQPGSAVTAVSYAPAVTFNLRYPGQQWDQETGLAYNINRYYDASSGRYIQADPIGLDGGWNRFAYVNGNPLSNVDPLGLAGFVPGGGGIVDTGDICQPLLPKNPLDDNGCLRPFVPGGPSLCVGPGSLGKAGPALGSMTKEELKALIGKDQTELLRQLFGTGIPGANNALSNLTRPDALTNQAVNAYRELAMRAINQYERSGNAAAAELQRLRVEILNRLK